MTRGGEKKSIEGQVRVGKKKQVQKIIMVKVREQHQDQETHKCTYRKKNNEHGVMPRKLKGFKKQLRMRGLPSYIHQILDAFHQYLSNLFNKSYLLP